MPQDKSNLLGWFNARDAIEAGHALADRVAASATAVPHGKRKSAPKSSSEVAREYLRRAVDEVRSLQLNIYKRARLVNSFKWRLLEQGVDETTAHDVTQTLVMEITVNQPRPVFDDEMPPDAKRSRVADDAPTLNNRGVELNKAGRQTEAEEHFRQAIAKRPHFPEAHGNLGAVYLSRGQFAAAENSLRRSLKLKPARPEVRGNLGMTLIALGRIPEARTELKAALRNAPRHASALYGMGLVARAEGQFAEAEALFNQALESNPELVGALAALVSIRKMTSADGAWLRRAEEIVAGSGSPVDESEIRFAIGKYFDDLGDNEQAFKNYKRANELRRSTVVPYDPEQRERFVNDTIRVYTREALSQAPPGGSDSKRPVFIVGMMRSGTSLAEQIVASHPAVAGAGELRYWGDWVAKDDEIRQHVLDPSERSRIAQEYLEVLSRHSADSVRVVDKMPLNSEFLGLIHSVFPNARFIYMRRDPIATCLSCYFQPFYAALNFTMRLSDLAHFYQQHQRLMAHWRTILPPGSLLEVPYESLVADQAGWTRKILSFLDLEWDERCLDFHRTQRPVFTSSVWQVRQKIYDDSVQHWRRYRHHIKPLLYLKDA